MQKEELSEGQADQRRISKLLAANVAALVAATAEPLYSRLIRYLAP